MQTHAQRRAALARANHIRAQRAQLKRDLASRRIDFADVVTNPPDWLHTARVWDFAIAVPKYGRVKVARIMRGLNVSPSRQFDELTTRQQAALLKAIA